MVSSTRDVRPHEFADEHDFERLRRKFRRAELGHPPPVHTNSSLGSFPKLMLTEDRIDSPAQVHALVSRDA